MDKYDAYEAELERYYERRNELMERGLSPTCLNMWLSDRPGWIRRYLSRVQEAQTPAMKLGWFFDAWIKHKLGLVGGMSVEEAESEIRRMFPDPSVGDSLLRAFETARQTYLGVGLTELQRLIGGCEVCVGGDADGSWSGRVEVPMDDGSSVGVTLYGKTDLCIRRDASEICSDGARGLAKRKLDWWLQLVVYDTIVPPEWGIVLDWKVNGYFSKSGVSPTAGYVGHSGYVSAYDGGPRLLVLDQMTFRPSKTGVNGRTVQHRGRVISEDHDWLLEVLRRFVSWVPTQEELFGEQARKSLAGDDLFGSMYG